MRQNGCFRSGGRLSWLSSGGHRWARLWCRGFRWLSGGRFGWLGRRRFSRRRRARNRSRPLLYGDQILSRRFLGRPLVEVGKGKVMYFAYAIGKGFYSGQKAFAITGRSDFWPHALSHVSDQTVGKISPSRPRCLGEELPIVGGNQQQNTLVQTGRSANLPIVGNSQRIIVEIFRAAAFHRRDHKVDPRPLLQIFQDLLQTSFGRGVEYFGKVVDVSVWPSSDSVIVSVRTPCPAGHQSLPFGAPAPGSGAFVV